MGTKVLSNQRVTVLAGLANGIANWNQPTLAELTALANVSGAVNWNSFDLGLKASDQNDDRTLTDGAGSQSRGFVNFGGTLQFVMPIVADTASVYRQAYNIFSTPRVELVVALRYGKSNGLAPAAGDRWTVFHVITDAVTFGQGDVSKFFQVNLIARDDFAADYIVPTATPATITANALSTTTSVGGLIFISAAYMGWDITKGATYVVSDETKLIQVHPGIFRGQASGSATVIVRYPGATQSAAVSVTVS